MVDIAIGEVELPSGLTSLVHSSLTPESPFGNLTSSEHSFMAKYG